MADTVTEPLVASAPAGKPAGPCAMVIFGATGDLTRRKLLPALYNLANYQLLSRDFALVGIAMDPLTDEQFRASWLEPRRGNWPSGGQHPRA